MKVIICFGPMRVVVPCGNGELTVRDLMDKAVHRYMKTLDKSSEVYVDILNLKTLDNNALLDPSDRVMDVVDDKEQLVATFALSEDASQDHRNGDGMSGGSPSPELLRAFHVYGKDFLTDFDPKTEAIVTPQDIASRNHNLIVRRCSNEAFSTSPSYGEIQHIKSSSLPSQMPMDISHKHERRKEGEKRDGHSSVSQSTTFGHHRKPLCNGLQNEFTSHSLKSNHFGRHIPMQSSPSCDFKNSGSNSHQNQNDINKSSFYQSGWYNCSLDSYGRSNNVESPNLQEKVISTKDMLGISTSNTNSEKERFVIKLTKAAKGLGFSITTQDNKTSENDSFIFVKKILPSGSAIEDGRLQPGDCILEVNGVPMTGKPQEEVVSILRQIRIGESVTLLVARATKFPCIPSNNFPVCSNLTKNSENKTDLNKNYSEGMSLHRKDQKECQHDTDSISSVEKNESRSSRPRFTREGIGRQSMSEKRKGHVDPRSTETFGKIQSRRSAERRGNINHSRSGSVDSVLDHSHNTVKPITSSSIEGGALGSFRSRAMNYSFRAAIDRCIDGDCLEDSLLKSSEVTESSIGGLEHQEKQRSFGTVLRFGKIKKSCKPT